MDSEGFREMICPIFQVLGMPQITLSNIMSYVKTREEAIRNEIMTLTKGKNKSILPHNEIKITPLE